MVIVPFPNLKIKGQGLLNVNGIKVVLSEGLGYGYGLLYFDAVNVAEKNSKFTEKYPRVSIKVDPEILQAWKSFFFDPFKISKRSNTILQIR